MYLARQIALMRYELEKLIKEQNKEMQKKLEKAKKALKTKSKEDKIKEIQEL